MCFIVDIMKINFRPSYKCKVIDKRLSVGKPILSPLRLYKMKNSGYTSIIDLRQHSIVSKFIEKSVCKLLNMQYKNIVFKTTNDDIPDLDFFRNINEQIIKNKGKTYLHCKHGLHRTSMCVAAYEKESAKIDNKTILTNFIKNFYANKVGEENRLSCVFNKFINLLKLN